MMRDTLCIDAGVHGGIAWCIEGEVFVSNMPKLPVGCKAKEFSEIQVEGIAQIFNDIDENIPEHISPKCWIEQVSNRNGDTDKTAWRFSANYHCWLMCFLAYSCPLKKQLPAHWMSQLGIELPSGQHNYDRRKKILRDFATSKFPEVQRMKRNKKGEVVFVKAKPTAQTADALCMLWVNSGCEL